MAQREDLHEEIDEIVEAMQAGIVVVVEGKRPNELKLSPSEDMDLVLVLPHLEKVAAFLDKANETLAPNRESCPSTAPRKPQNMNDATRFPIAMAQPCLGNVLLQQ